MRVYRELSDDNVGVVAAGVAYFAVLAVIPVLAALVSLYGLVAEPEQIAGQVSQLAVLPVEARRLIQRWLLQVVAQPTEALSLGAVVSLAVSLWLASRGTAAVIRAVNIAYDEEARRGMLRRHAMAYGFTVALVSGAAVAFLLVVAVPVAIAALGLDEVSGVAYAVSLLRWPVLFVLVAGALSALYRYGPKRARPKWRWVVPGALLATVLWIGGSMLLSAYVRSFGRYEETYGSFGAVVVLLLWIFLSAYVVLLGAELNAEMEHQTRIDTTVGRSRPMGQRGAFVADHLGACQSPPPLPRWLERPLGRLWRSAPSRPRK